MFLSTFQKFTLYKFAHALAYLDCCSLSFSEKCLRLDTCNTNNLRQFPMFVFLKGILQKMKEGAENIEKKVQARVESLKTVVDSNKGNHRECCEQTSQLVVLTFLDAGDATPSKKTLVSKMEATHVMEVAQLLLSLLHSWGLDPHLDKVCESQLGLLKPMVGV